MSVCPGDCFFCRLWLLWQVLLRIRRVFRYGRQRTAIRGLRCDGVLLQLWSLGQHQRGQGLESSEESTGNGTWYVSWFACEKLNTHVTSSGSSTYNDEDEVPVFEKAQEQPAQEQAPLHNPPHGKREDTPRRHPTRSPSQNKNHFHSAV